MADELRELLNERRPEDDPELDVIPVSSPPERPSSARSWMDSKKNQEMENRRREAERLFDLELKRAGVNPKDLSPRADAKKQEFIEEYASGINRNIRQEASVRAAEAFVIHQDDEEIRKNAAEEAKGELQAVVENMNRSRDAAARGDNSSAAYYRLRAKASQNKGILTPEEEAEWAAVVAQRDSEKKGKSEAQKGLALLAVSEGNYQSARVIMGQNGMALEDKLEISAALDAAKAKPPAKSPRELGNLDAERILARRDAIKAGTPPEPDKQEDPLDRALKLETLYERRAKRLKREMGSAFDGNRPDPSRDQVQSSRHATAILERMRAIRRGLGR